MAALEEKGAGMAVGEVETAQALAGIERELKSEPWQERTTTVADLMARCDFAVQRMSRGNPHRLLLLQCAAAIWDLANRAMPREGAPES